MAQVDRPSWLEPHRIRATITRTALERLDFVAEQAGVSRGKVLDTLLRAADLDRVPDAIIVAENMDARQITAWRESSTPS